MLPWRGRQALQPSLAYQRPRPACIGRRLCTQQAVARAHHGRNAGLRAMLKINADQQTGLLSLRKIGFYDVLSFLIPLTQFIEFKFIGHLYAPVIELAILFPILFVSRGRMLNRRLPSMFLLLGTLWLLSQVITDLIRQSTFHDYSRGWALIAFTLVDFASLYLLLVGRQRRIMLYAAGLAIGGILAYFFNPNIFTHGHPWKFGYGFAVTFLLALFATYVGWRHKYRPLWPAMILMSSACLNIYMGFRSLGGVCFLASVYLLMQKLYGRSFTNNIRFKKRSVLIIAFAIAFGAFGILKTYEYAAGSGFLGVKAQQLYEGQSEGKYGLLLGGRSELLVSGRAILASPIIGYGSWAKNCYYASLLTNLQLQLGYAAPYDNNCLLPTHSFIFGAWVDAGILGAVFWIWVLTLSFRVITRLYRTLEPMTPLIAFIVFNITWNIFFSPYGAERIFTEQFYVIVMMEALYICGYGKGVRR